MVLMGFLFSGNPLGLILSPLNMCITSVMYGWLKLRSGSIWVVSLAHAAGNTMITPLLSSLLPNLSWPLVWAGYRLTIFALLVALMVFSDPIKVHTQAVD